MPPNDFDWEKKYGKNPSEMAEGEFKMAVLSQLYELSEDFQCIKVRVQPIARHEMMFKILCWGALPFFSFLGWLVIKVMGG